MDHGELTAKDAPSLESVHEVKLEALLNDLVKREGKIRAATVSYTHLTLPTIYSV